VFNARTQHINVFAEMRPSEEDELAAAEAGEHPADARQPSDAELETFLRQREEVQFKQAEQQLRLAIDASSELKGLANNLLVDNTPEGLRIQIVDQEGMAMFPLGSAAMLPHTQALIELVARIVEKMPQDIEISGHTDANPFSGEHDYGNWELSADRANAARRMFVRAGVPEARIMRVVGKAATAPLFPHEPKAPGNRRLSVVLLRGTGDAT
jgi:chemotaxis protein MotB